MRIGHTLQGFSAGILSPDIHGRHDFDKLKLGVADASNFLVKPTGAISYRVGKRFIAETKYSEKESTLIKFGSSREAVYAIEVGDLYMRFFRNGAAIVQSFAVTNGTFNAGIASWTDKSVGSGSIAWNAGDQTMTITGAGSGDDGHAEQAFTTVVDQDYVFNVDVIDNPLKVLVGTTTGGSEIAEKTIQVGTARQIFFKATATTTYVGFKQDAALASDIDNVTAVEPIELTTTYAEADVKQLRYVQDGEDLYITHPTYPPRKLTRTSDTVWAITNMVFDPAATSVTGLGLVAAAAPTVPRAFTWRYTVTTEFDDGTESLPFTTQSIAGDIEIADRLITITLTVPVETGVRYKIYRQGGGEMYLVHIADPNGTTSIVVVDSGFTADESRSPPNTFGSLASTNNYPIACGLYNQRLVLGGTNNEPDRLWFSRVREYENFTSTPILADDEGFNKRLSAGSVNKISHLQALDDLMCLTDGKIWRIQGSSNNTMNAFVESSVGSSNPKPFPTRKSLLFVENGGNSISDFIYKDTVNGFDGDPLDILAKNLFRQFTITDLSFQSNPEGLLYAVRSDGKMLVLTYLKNQNVYAWTYYETDGSYESVVSVDQDVFDDTYVIVNRTIDGVTRRYVELFETQYHDIEGTGDDWYLDASIRYDGSATTMVGGLDHLIGEEVSVYADSDVLANVTVDADGYITLPASYSKILIGKQYDGIIKLIRPETSTQTTGTTIGVERSIIKGSMAILNSRGFFTSNDGVTYIEQETTDADEIGDSIPKVTDTFDFDLLGDNETSPDVYIAQKRPLPLTILNITLDINYGKR